MADDTTGKTVGEVFSALDACLEKEKTALLTGDLDAISSLMEEKSDLISQLNALGATEDHALDALKDKAERNQVLLGSALDGIRRVADRLSAMQSLRHSFDTYDSRGQRKTIEGEVVRHVEKRA
ncbi:MAG: flagellar protein FlgN [Pseudomonadota bacterium]